MGISENKKLVRDYFRLSGEARHSEAAALLADDFAYRCRGKTPETSATRTKTELMEAIAKAPEFWKRPVAISIEEMTAEGDRVAVQAESHGQLHDGTEYNNAYHFLIRIEDGKIRSLDEYFCTATFRDVIFTRRGRGAGG